MVKWYGPEYKVYGFDSHSRRFPTPTYFLMAAVRTSGIGTLSLSNKACGEKVLLKIFTTNLCSDNSSKN